MKNLVSIPLAGSSEDAEALWTLWTILVRHVMMSLNLTLSLQVMAVFWIFELLPLPITSLLPLVLLPLAGVASTDEVARNYLKVGVMWSGHVTRDT